MFTQFIHLFWQLLALVVGAAVGFAFGLLQNAALRRHQRLQQQGKFKSGWSATPGSFRRVAYLLVALAVVQVVCPFLFDSLLTSWCVSAGVVLGYGWMLYKQLRQRRATGW